MSHGSASWVCEQVSSVCRGLSLPASSPCCYRCTRISHELPALRGGRKQKCRAALASIFSYVSARSVPRLFSSGNPALPAPDHQLTLLARPCTLLQLRRWTGMRSNGRWRCVARQRGTEETPYSKRTFDECGPLFGTGYQSGLFPKPKQHTLAPHTTSPSLSLSLSSSIAASYASPVLPAMWKSERTHMAGGDECLAPKTGEKIEVNAGSHVPRQQLSSVLTKQR